MNAHFKPQPVNAAEVNIAEGETVAFVSTKREGADRWTELLVTYLPDASGRCFVADIVGQSTRPGDVIRRKRIYVGSLARALRHFETDSDATDSIIAQAEDWEERNRERIKADILKQRQLEKAPASQPYLGSTLLGAVQWLYGSAQAGMAQRLADDFGVPRRTVADALDKEQGGQALSGWAKAFVSAMRYFDRAAFHAAKGAPADA